MQGVSLIVIAFSAVVVTHVSGFTFKFNGNQQTPGGSIWNAFRAYPVAVAAQEEPKESEEDPEYMYELLFGHRIRDVEKYKRQQGCLCNNRFRDPHCGSDYKIYDNGCYFECAQKRTPGLKLLNWGKC